MRYLDSAGGPPILPVMRYLRSDRGSHQGDGVPAPRGYVVDSWRVATPGPRGLPSVEPSIQLSTH
jgi:hypothetical protein